MTRWIERGKEREITTQVYIGRSIERERERERERGGGGGVSFLLDSNDDDSIKEV